MKKRALISFKYIFVIIAGALILIFFVRFAFQYKTISEKLTAREIVFTIDDALDAFSVSTESNKDIDLNLETTLKFDCNTINYLDYTKKTNKIIFSPTTLKGKALQAWTLSWEFPFTITNFFYLTNKKTKFYLIYDQSSFSEVNNIYNNIPTRFNKVVTDKNFNINSIKTTTRYLDKVNFIFFTQPDNADEIAQKLNNENIVQVKLNENRVIFYPNKESFYLGKEMLYGVIFSSNYDNYECTLKNSLEKLSLVSELYSKKAYLLWLKSNKQVCKNKYLEIKNTLQRFKNLNNPTIFYQYLTILNNQNQELSKNDCPILF